MLKFISFSCLFLLGNASDRPIIAVLTQELSEIVGSFPQYDTYIAASYVKYIEAAGARVVPVWLGQPLEYYKRVIEYTNGFLIPGGAASFTRPKGYGETVRILYKLAEKVNDKGTYYPIWGTCLGMEVLSYAQLGIDIRSKECPEDHISLPIVFENGYKNSKLFSRASPEIVDILESKNVTFNTHIYCITRSVLKANGISNDWQVLSTNRGTTNIEFISTLEHKTYPFYGVQYHPEKNLFEFNKGNNVSHTKEAVLVTQYFASFFIDEARKNENSFPNSKIESDSLIYNYCPLYTNSYFVQIYGFTNSDYKKSQLI